MRKQLFGELLFVNNEAANFIGDDSISKFSRLGFCCNQRVELLVDGCGRFSLGQQGLKMHRGHIAFGVNAQPSKT